MYFLSYICTLFLAALKRPAALWAVFHRKFTCAVRRRQCAVCELGARKAREPILQLSSFPARFRFGPYANGPP